MSRTRVLIVVRAFPELSESYIATEADELAKTCDVQLLTFEPSYYPFRSPHPVFLLTAENEREVLERVREFSPEVVHGHFFTDIERIAQVAAFCDVGFTVRSHSSDVLCPPPETLRRLAAFANQERCLGVIAFPFNRPILEANGVRGDKIVDGVPVVSVDRFHDSSPNGEDVLHLGAAFPKKGMDDFIRLSVLVPRREFNLYAISHDSRRLHNLNGAMGGRVRLVVPVEPQRMARHYKRHQWLVYSASPTVSGVGWPVAVIEAMAAGVGVCMRNIRPDIADFVGDSGILFDRIEDIADTVAQPVPSAMRERAFSWARRFDIATHIRTLTSLWGDRAGHSTPDDGFVIRSYPESPSLTATPAAQGKRALDLALAVPLAVLVTPLAILAALAIRIEDGGPAIEAVPCLGRGGAEFPRRRFRTMARPLDHSPPRQDDPASLAITSMRRPAPAKRRRLRTGALIERARLAGLPQIINVLAGNMSVIGPRWQGDATAALTVRPGLVGAWQARRPEETRDRAAVEQAYAAEWTPMADMQVLTGLFSRLIRLAIGR